MTVEQRPRFYESQYLEAADLMGVVAYSRANLARTQLGGHRWGIAIGLELSEVAAAGGALDVFVQPGYAWDGFGRAMVVAEPHKLTGGLFAAIDAGFVPGNPAQVVEVWIGYRETMTQGPRPGFEDCAVDGSLARVVESYRIEVGRRPTTATQRDPVEIAGRQIDAAQALSVFDPTAPPLYDASVPHQAFPEERETARWLVPLGVVMWEPGNPGHFVPRDDAALARHRRSRQYCGVVAGSVEATAGQVRVHDRGKPYATETDELLSVEGDLRVDGDARIYGHRVQFVQSHTESPILPFHLLRHDDVAGTKLQVVIGDSTAGSNRLAVGRRTSVDPTTGVETDAEDFVVTDSGRVGIGTSQPTALLHLQEDGLQIGTSATPEDNFHIQSNTDGPRGLRIYNRDVGAGSHVASFTQTGRLGLGTTDPTHPLHVQGNLGIRQNALYLSGGHRDWSSVSYNAHHSADNADWVFPDPGKPTATIEMDSSDAGRPRVELFTSVAGGNTLWRSRLKVFGHSGDIGMAATEGNVGIGTYSPAAKLDVRGEILFASALMPVGAPTGLRLVWGNVSDAGIKVTGDGFSVTRLGTGRYEITFVPAFPSVPTVVVTKVWESFEFEGGASVDAQENAIVDRVLATAAIVATATRAGALDDSNFCFLAFGPR